MFKVILGVVRAIWSVFGILIGAFMILFVLGLAFEATVYPTSVEYWHPAVLLIYILFLIVGPITLTDSLLSLKGKSLFWK